MKFNLFFYIKILYNNVFGKIKTFKYGGHLFQYSNDLSENEIVYDDWFTNINLPYPNLFHHSYSEEQWDKFDKKHFRKIIKTSLQSFVFEKIEKF